MKKRSISNSQWVKSFIRGRKTTRVNLWFLIFCFTFLLSQSLMAAPYNGDTTKLKQPDGSYVSVRAFGDEYYVRIESIDGYTLIRDSESGWICYAELNEDESEFISTKDIYFGAIESSYGHSAQSKALKHPAQKGLKLNNAARIKIIEKNIEQLNQEPGNQSQAERNHVEFYSPASSPYDYNVIGDKVGLTLLIDFPDEKSSITQTEINDFCNQIGYTGYGNNGSIRDYFQDVSGGLLNYTNYVSAFYTAKNPKSYYTDTAIGHGQRARELILEALNSLESQGFDFSTLSVDADSRILGINAFYAGFSDAGWAQGLWPHASYLFDFSADDVSSYRYQITNIGNSLRIRTFCHENGHMLLNWRDLYDYGHESKGAGNYCLMGYGGNNSNPVPPNPYFRWLAGWQTMTVMNGTTHGTVFSSVANDLLSHQYINPLTETEFFLLDNVLKTGRSSNIPDEGLLVWHIDERGSNNNEQMTPTQHYKVSIEQGDGLFQMEYGYNYGDTNDLFHKGYKEIFNDYSIPDALWWSGDASDLNISNIGTVGPELDFTYNALKTAPIIFRWATEDGDGDGAWKWSHTWQSGGSVIEVGNSWNDLSVTTTQKYEGNSSLKFHFTHNGTGTAGGSITTGSTGAGIEAASETEKETGKNLTGFQYLKLYLLGSYNTDLALQLEDSDGELTNYVKLSDYTDVAYRSWHGTLIPVADFDPSLIDISSVKSINVSIPESHRAGDYTIYLDNISFVKYEDPYPQDPPIAYAGPDQSVKIGDFVTLDGSTSYDPDSGPDTLGYTWSQVSGSVITLSDTVSVNPTFTPSITGIYVFKLTVYDGKDYDSSNVTITVSDPNQPVIAVNAGGDAYITSSGIQYDADRNFTGGKVAKSTDAISGTSDDILYQSERWGLSSYAFPGLTNGDYRIKFQFAETYWTASNKRLFDIKVQGQTLINDLDIYNSVRKNVAHDITINTQVTDGTLTIEFINASVDQPKISSFIVYANDDYPIANAGPAQSVNVGDIVILDGSASYDPDNGPEELHYEWIKVSGTVVSLSDRLSVNPTFISSVAGIFVYKLTVYDGKNYDRSDVTITVLDPNPPVIAVNAGGDAYTASNGIQYDADRNFTGGKVAKSTDAISGTRDDILYQSERWGVSSYTFPGLADGDYRIIFQFAETYWTASNKRIFDVKVQGQNVINHLDIYNSAGVNAIHDIFINAQVTDGTLTIEFINGYYDQPKISSFVVYAGDGGQ